MAPSAVAFASRRLLTWHAGEPTVIAMSHHALAETRAWVERAVIGLQLCPFARAPQVKGQVRYVVSEASDTATLLEALIDELQRLADEPAERVETTLLVHPSRARRLR